MELECVGASHSLIFITKFDIILMLQKKDGINLLTFCLSHLHRRIL